MLHSRVSSPTLAIVRIAVFAMWLKHTAGDSVERYLRTPLESFTQIGLLAWIPDAWWPWLYRAEPMRGARVALLVGIAWCTLGLRPYRPIAVATCIGLTLYQAFVRGYGHIHHGELAMLFAAYVLSVYPAGRFRGDESEAAQPLNRAAMLTLCLVLCLTYSFVGAQRLLNGGFSIFVDGTILHYIALRSFETSLDAPGLGRLALAVPALGAATAMGFALTTVCELLSPLAIVSRPLRWVWVPTILGFHVAAGLLMGIWFTANIALVLLCMTDLETLLERGKAARSRLRLRPRRRPT